MGVLAGIEVESGSVDRIRKREDAAASEVINMKADDNAGASASESTDFRELIDEKVTIEGGIDPAREQELGALLQSLPGVHSVTMAGNEVSITYEPTEITSKEMHQRMRRAGFTPGDRAIAPAVPPVNTDS